MRCLRVFIVVGILAGLAATAGGANATPRERSIKVPDVTQGPDLRAAYRALRRTGFRVRVTRTFDMASLCQRGVARQQPRAGALVRRASTVSIRPGPCFLASPAVPTGPLPTARVPDMNGWTAQRAVRWAERAGLYWHVDRLRPLQPSSRPSLFDNYRVTGQRPAAGSKLTLGITLGQAGGFLPTPLTLDARRRDRYVK